VESTKVADDISCNESHKMCTHICLCHESFRESMASLTTFAVLCEL